MQCFPSGPWLFVLLAAPALLATGRARADEPTGAPSSLAAQPLPVAPLPPQPAAQPARWAPRDEEHRGAGNWYGWQTLIAVAPFDIAMFVGLPQYGNSTAYTATFVTGFVGRNLAPAVVHLAHGRGAAAFGSVGLHAAATATGVALGYGIGLGIQGACPPRSPCRNGFRDLPPGPGYGALAGSMSATVLDVVFFSYRHKLSWTASAPVAPVRTAWALAPYAAPGSAGLAAAGTF